MHGSSENQLINNSFHYEQGTMIFDKMMKRDILPVFTTEYTSRVFPEVPGSKSFTINTRFVPYPGAS